MSDLVNLPAPSELQHALEVFEACSLAFSRDSDKTVSDYLSGHKRTDEEIDTTFRIVDERTAATNAVNELGRRILRAWPGLIPLAPLYLLFAECARTEEAFQNYAQHFRGIPERKRTADDWQESYRVGYSRGEARQALRQVAGTA